MYQEVCFNRGTEAGGRGGNVGHSVSPPRSFYACYGPVMSLTVQCELDDTWLQQFLWYFRLFKFNKKKKFREFFFFASLENSHLSARLRWPVLSYYTVLLVLKSGQLTANQIWQFCYSYDLKAINKCYWEPIRFENFVIDTIIIYNKF